MRTSRDTSASTLHRLSRAGHLHRVLPGIYLEDSELTDVTARCAAVCVWDESAAVSHHAAAHLTFWKELPVKEISVSCRRRPHAPGYLFTRAMYDPACVIDFKGLRLTHPAVTALELAPETEGKSIDAALRSRMTTMKDLRTAMEHLQGRHGVGPARKYLHASRDNPWSPAEREGHRALRRHRITGWKANYLVTFGKLNFFLDIAFPAQKVAVEIDGFEFHSNHIAFVEDRRRANRLTLHGWTVLRFAATDIFDHPDEFVATIRAALKKSFPK